MHLDLDQNPAESSAVEAGIDAKDAGINLAKTLDLEFTALGNGRRSAEVTVLSNVAAADRLRVGALEGKHG